MSGPARQSGDDAIEDTDDELDAREFDPEAEQEALADELPPDAAPWNE